MVKTGHAYSTIQQLMVQ